MDVHGQRLELSSWTRSRRLARGPTALVTITTITTTLTLALAAFGCGDDGEMMEYEPIECVGEIDVPDEALRELLIDVIGTPPPSGDTDTDGEPDFQDVDDDGDLIPTLQEGDETVDGDGDGTAGGLYSLRFDVLPSDATGDGRTNGSDLAPFSLAFNSQIGQASYNVRADWNADGRVNGSDLAVLTRYFNQRLDSRAEPGEPFSTGRASIYDLIFGMLGDEDGADQPDA